MSNFLTNGHDQLGLKDPESTVPSIPLRQSGGRTSSRLSNGYNVQDEKGAFMAFFRNKEDADNFCAIYNNHSNR